MKGDLISRCEAIEKMRIAGRFLRRALATELSGLKEWPLIEGAIVNMMSRVIDILGRIEPEGWHKTEDGDPEPEHATEYIVMDKAGIISGRVYYPGKGAIDAVKDLPPVFEWIPIDKPPEAFGRYLVMAADWGSWRIDFDFWIDGRWAQHVDVEAWAEIPEEWRE